MSEVNTVWMLGWTYYHMYEIVFHFHLLTCWLNFDFSTNPITFNLSYIAELYAKLVLWLVVTTFDSYTSGLYCWNYWSSNVPNRLVLFALFIDSLVLNPCLFNQWLPLVTANRYLHLWIVISVTLNKVCYIKSIILAKSSMSLQTFVVFFIKTKQYHVHLFTFLFSSIKRHSIVSHFPFSLFLTREWNNFHIKKRTQAETLHYPTLHSSSRNRLLLPLKHKIQQTSVKNTKSVKEVPV